MTRRHCPAAPDPDLKSDRCIYYNSERRSARAPSARSLARGVRGHASLKILF